MCLAFDGSSSYPDTATALDTSYRGLSEIRDCMQGRREEQRRRLNIALPDKVVSICSSGSICSGPRLRAVHPLPECRSVSARAESSYYVRFSHLGQVVLECPLGASGTECPHVKTKVVSSQTPKILSRSRLCFRVPHETAWRSRRLDPLSGEGSIFPAPGNRTHDLRDDYLSYRV